MQEELRQFFIICQLGLEEELSQEILEVWPFLLGKDARPTKEWPKNLQVNPGGISLSAPLIVGLQLNFFLRLATRVLLRLDEFKVRDISKLIRKLKDLKLPSSEFSIEVSCKSSKLNNEKKLLELARSVFKSAIQDSSAQTLYIRIFDDHCSLSMDSSGEPLYRRGLKLSGGEAPLRETMAAWALRKLRAGVSTAELKEVQLVDPMAGSGTLVLEAHDLFSINFARPFAFLDWRESPALLKSDKLAFNYPSIPRQPFASIFAKDLQDDQLEVLRSNCRGLEISVSKEDLFASKNGQQDMATRIWLILNPPYGERLAKNFTWDKLLSTLVEKYLPERIAIFIPKKQLNQVPKFQGQLVLESSFSTQHGGLALELCIFHRTS